MNFVAPGDLKTGWDDVKERSNDLKKSDQIVEKSMKLDICELAGKEASRFRKEFQKTSRLIRQSQKIDEWRWSDLEIGTLLGTGTFCQVYEVSLRKNCKLQANEIITGAESFRSHSMGKNEGKSKLSPKYALKRLNPKYIKGSDDFSDCAIDLVMEAGILACLHHPNIIRLRAVAAGSISNSFKRQGGYFLVLSRLSGTLSERISQWANEEILISTQKKSVRLKDRLGMIVFGVARGMEYLHKNKVIFRDLKPSNVGFDFNGEIKLFDFGLAREILDDGRKMTAYTGSARYMAPEVARGDYYGFPADVYSFSILLWEVCTLEKAYKGMSKKEHMEFVVGLNMRPNLHILDDDPSLRNFIEMCWCQEPKSRPTFREIKTRIPAEFLLHACLLDSSRSNRYVRLKSRTGAVPSQSSDLKRIIDSFNGSIKF